MWFPLTTSHNIAHKHSGHIWLHHIVHYRIAHIAPQIKKNYNQNLLVYWSNIVHIPIFLQHSTTLHRSSLLPHILAQASYNIASMTYHYLLLIPITVSFLNQNLTFLHCLNYYALPYLHCNASIAPAYPRKNQTQDKTALLAIKRFIRA